MEKSYYFCSELNKQFNYIVEIKYMSTKKIKRKITVSLQPAMKAGIRCVQAYPRDEEQTTQPKLLQLPGRHCKSLSTGGLYLLKALDSAISR